MSSTKKKHHPKHTRHSRNISQEGNAMSSTKKNHTTPAHPQTHSRHPSSHTSLYFFPKISTRMNAPSPQESVFFAGHTKTGNSNPRASGSICGYASLHPSTKRTKTVHTGQHQHQPTPPQTCHKMKTQDSAHNSGNSSRDG